MAKKKEARTSARRRAAARKSYKRKCKKWYVLPACILIAVALVFLVIKLTTYIPPETAIQPVQEQPAVIEAPIEPVEEAELVTAKLTRNRTMEPSEIRIKVGTTVIWENDDVYPHYILIYKKTDMPELREEDFIRSQKIYPKPPYDKPFVEKGEVVFSSFNYTFVEKGEYIVRDVYSEELRGEITARVVQTLGIEIGRIVVG